MRILFISFLIAVIAIVMFHLGRNSKMNLDKTIVLTAKDQIPSEGDLMRVKYVNGNNVYLCIID